MTEPTKPTTDAVLDLEDRHAAWLAGYDLGLIHGRDRERAIIEQEQRSACAGAIVTRLISLPEVHPRRTRAVIGQ